MSIFKFNQSATIAALVDGIPELFTFSEGQKIRGEIVNRCEITGVTVIRRSTNDLFSLPTAKIERVTH